MSKVTSNDSAKGKSIRNLFQGTSFHRKIPFSADPQYRTGSNLRNPAVICTDPVR